MNDMDSQRKSLVTISQMASLFHRILSHYQKNVWV